MIKKFLLFATLLISQKLIICADECSVFSCSQLGPSAETGQTCSFTGTDCESIFTSCGELSIGDCSTAKVKFTSPIQECYWNVDAQGGPKCETKQKKCSDFASIPPPVPCEELQASEGKYCITVNSLCVEETGCSSEGTCADHKPLDTNHKWDHLRICEETTEGTTTVCESKLKLCGDFENNGDDCSKLSTSDNNKKKCVLLGSGSCDEKYKTCESYTGDDINKNDCEAISEYIEDKNNYKCEYVSSGSGSGSGSSICKTERKKCSDFDQNESLCNNYTPEDSKKRCVHTTIGSTTKCYELPKKCSDLNALTDIKDEDKDEDHCKAIEEDPYSECIWDTSSGSGSCKRKPNECELTSHNSVETCNNILIDNTHKCEFIDDSCVKVEIYTNCNQYTGNDRTKCEQIKPPESNKRCILQNDKQCVSVPKECESYGGDSEYECINNYKPLDENYKCVFNLGCHKELKYQKEYCYQGDESSTICEAIIPKNNGEKYSIKCKYENSKCVRVEKPCEDYTGTDSKECSSIIPKDQNKKCILRNNQCKEEYKTCKAYNDDTSVTTIVQTTCESIISNDGKKCKYTAGESGARGTCASDIKNKCVDTLFNSEVTLSSACASIKLSDISKKCSFSNGECLSKSKSCLELVFNGNEEGIENMCKSAEASESDKKCIISPDKKRCLEVDKNLVIEDEPSSPGDNGNTNDSTNGNGPNQPEGPKGTEGDKGTEGEKGTEGADESKPNSGKTIYLNSLIAMILFLLL